MASWIYEHGLAEVETWLYFVHHAPRDLTVKKFKIQRVSMMVVESARAVKYERLSLRIFSTLNVRSKLGYL